MIVSREEIKKKASGINELVFGRTRRKKVKLADALKLQVEESIRYSIEKALQTDGISPESKKAFVELLKEEKGMVNVLLAGAKEKEKAVRMLEPLFGEKSGEFMNNFQEIFNALQEEMVIEKKRYTAS